MTDVLKGHSLVWKETALYARVCRGSKCLRLMYLIDNRVKQLSKGW